MSKYDHIEDAWVREALEEYKDKLMRTNHIDSISVLIELKNPGDTSCG